MIDKSFIRQFVRETFKLEKKEQPVDKKLSVLSDIERRIAGVRKAVNDRR
jgi:hypothetical protein